MAATHPTGADVLERMDESKLTGLHWKIMFISGMGFFTDAYDLFIIGVVMALLKEQWSISPTEEGLVASTALLASAVGAVLFGRIADMVHPAAGTVRSDQLPRQPGDWIPGKADRGRRLGQRRLFRPVDRGWSLY
jgi:MFS family permease